jgi:hypothetical protein
MGDTVELAAKEEAESAESSPPTSPDLRSLDLCSPASAPGSGEMVMQTITLLGEREGEGGAAFPPMGLPPIARDAPRLSVALPDGPKKKQPGRHAMANF